MHEAGANCLVLSFEGGLSWEDRDVLANEVERWIQPRPAVRDIVLDMSAVQYVNSAGLGALFQLYRRVHQRGGRLLFANVPALVARVFDAVGLDRLAELTPDLRGALERVGAPVVPGFVAQPAVSPAPVPLPALQPIGAAPVHAPHQPGPVRLCQAPPSGEEEAAFTGT